MATDAAEVVKLLKGPAKTAPIGFAFGTNAKDGELVAEKGKSGEQLLGTLKKLPGIKQSCVGEVGYDGSTLIFTCDRPIQGFAKSVEAWGKAAKFSFKVEVQSKKEAAAETENEEEDDDEGNALFSLDQVKHRLLQSKTKDMFFAFGLGQSKAPDLLGLHPIKTGDRLIRIVRKENSAIKRAWGKVVLAGSMTTFYCEDEPFSSMKRALRKLFKGWKLPIRVTLIGPAGEFNEEGDEDEDIEVEGQEASQPADDQAALRRLDADLAAMLPKLKELFAALPDQAASIRANYASCQAAIKSENAAEAEKLLAALKAIGTASGTGGSNAGDDLARLRKELDQLVPSVRELAKNPALAEQARTLWTDAGNGLKASDAAVASKAIEELKRMIADGGPAKIDYDALGKSWADTRGAAEADIKKLADAIMAEYGSAAEAGDIRQGLRKLDAVMANLSTEMADLFAGATSADRTKLHDTAQGLIARYRRYVDGDPLLAEIDGNPFTPIQVKQRFSQTLSAIETALAA